MVWLLLAAAATLFSEVSVSIGKFEVALHKESIYTVGFLNLFWSTIFFFFIILFIRQDFLFSLDSLPTFGIRAFLEIAQAHVGVLALTRADRSTVGFIMIGTIPLLLIIDVVLGYAIGFLQMIGIGIIILAFIFLLINHGIRKKGIWYVVFVTVNAAITISLFKYNITHFNSVEAEQGLMSLIVLIYFFLMAFFIAKESPMQFFKKPIFFIQSASSGIGGVLMSFAYLFAAASVITAAKRAFTVLWTILSGKVYFHEKHLFVKLVSFALIAAGLVFLVI